MSKNTKKNLNKKSKKSLQNKKKYLRDKKSTLRYKKNRLRNIKKSSKRDKKKIKTFDMSKYKFVTEGTCQSNKMKNLTLGECRYYLPDTNYKVSRPNHGPPGCWLRLGDDLRADRTDLNDDGSPIPGNQGFACWTRSNLKDELRCSPGNPCICK